IATWPARGSGSGSSRSFMSRGSHHASTTMARIDVSSPRSRRGSVFQERQIDAVGAHAEILVDVRVGRVAPVPLLLAARCAQLRGKVGAGPAITPVTGKRTIGNRQILVARSPGRHGRTSVRISASPPLPSGDYTPPTDRFKPPGRSAGRRA